MNKRRKWTIVLTPITVFVMLAAFLPGLVRAGDLEPSAPPGSTMHTLDEIYNKLEQLTPGASAPVVRTGQTTTYAAGDDGDLQKGVAWTNLRFTDHGDGTVTDTLTGLMWTKDANIYGMRNWTEALLDCASCTEGGHSDWRLPNVRELHSLIDYGQWYPPLPLGHPFSKVQAEERYWSSTTFCVGTSGAWFVSFGGGGVSANDKSADSNVWCVRGGQ